MFVDIDYRTNIDDTDVKENEENVIESHVRNFAAY